MWNNHCPWGNHTPPYSWGSLPTTLQPTHVLNHLYALQGDIGTWTPLSPSTDNNTMRYAVIYGLIPVKLTQQILMQQPDWDMWEKSEFKQHMMPTKRNKCLAILSHHLDNMLMANKWISPSFLLCGHTYTKMGTDKRYAEPVLGWSVGGHLGVRVPFSTLFTCPLKKFHPLNN